MIIQRVKSAVILALSAVNGGTNSGARNIIMDRFLKELKILYLFPYRRYPRI